jgi:hypothetical protein
MLKGLTERRGAATGMPGEIAQSGNAKPDRVMNNQRSQQGQLMSPTRRGEEG